MTHLVSAMSRGSTTTLRGDVRCQRHPERPTAKHGTITTRRASGVRSYDGATESRNRIADANYPLVWAMARYQLVSARVDVLELGDPAIAGESAPLRAMQRFNADGGRRISTYASRFIRWEHRTALRERRG
jgi:DNA-directed RNA polymerase specialized sigma subunit